MLEYKEHKTKSSKNASEPKWKYYSLNEDISMLSCDSSEASKISLNVNPTIVQYFFCVEGSANFGFFFGAYKIDLKGGENFFFYNPKQKLKPTITTSPGTRLVCIFTGLEKIHELFLDQADSLHFLKGENASKKFYKKNETDATIEVALNQIINEDLHSKTLDIFRYAKALEILSLYFSAEARQENASCPYLNDEESVRKIKNAKEILIKRMASPPMISELAIEVGLNEHRLKEGFKGLYGSTLFQYLLDYKMNKGRNMLDSGKYKVKEVAYDLGYHNPSHFITAFKNKFGVTPKKYLMGKV